MVAQGYKQTEVGAIPDDWEVKRLGEVLKVRHGKSQKEVENKTGGAYPILGTGGLMSYADAFLYNKPSVLIGRKGTIDKPRYMDTPFWSVDTLFYTEVFEGNNAKFLYYTFLLIDWYSYNEASGVPSLNAKTIEYISVPIPTLSEQTAIATALSDTDSLISSLEGLIAKKRNIKQGAMTTLLSPKEGWEVKKLGEIGNFFSGGTPDTSNPNYYGGSINWITSGDLNKGIINDVEGRITVIGLQNSSAQIVYPNTLLLAMYGATAGITAITKIKGAINQAILAINTIDNYDTFFLFQLLTLLKDWVITTYTQGGQPNLSGGIVKKIELSFPKKEEQKRIATILSDMDNEIVALETKLEKYKQIKQGMMTNLLTGKIRLV